MNAPTYIPCIALGLLPTPVILKHFRPSAFQVRCLLSQQFLLSAKCWIHKDEENAVPGPLMNSTVDALSLKFL